ncbi:MAG TPA: polysaccharide biosynthesis protein [Clostridia bacterium]|nr:polysaccharide biosynthesis protein [Clostridia bacterium]
MKKRQNSFVQGAAILGIAGLLVKIIGAIFRIPFANAAGPEGAAYYDAAYPYYSFLLVISSSGLPTAISKQVSASVAMGDHRGAREVLDVSLVLLAVIGLVTSLVMFFGAKTFAAITTFEETILSFRALAPSLLFVSVMCAYRGYLQGMQRMTGTALSQIVEQVGKLAIGLTLAIKLLPKGPEYAAMGALIGVSVSEFLALAVVFFFYMRRKKAFDAKAARSDTEPMGFSTVAKTLLLIAVPITIGASISPLTAMVDSALIVRMLQTLGYSEQVSTTAYALLRTYVTTLINMPGVLTMALAMSLVPAISARMARRDFNGVRDASRMGLKLALIIGIPCAVGLFVLAEPILRMLYPKLSDSEIALAVDLMHTASVGVIFLSMVQSMTGVIQGLGKQMVPVINLFIGFILKVVTLIVLMRIPSINIQGASISTVVCYAFAGIADTIYMMRRTKLPLRIFDLFGKPLVASLAMGGVVYLIYGFISKSGHMTIATLFSVLVGVSVYAVLVLALRMFSPDELDFVPGGGKLKKLMYRDRSRRA